MGLFKGAQSELFGQLQLCDLWSFCHVIGGHRGQDFMSAMLALLHLNFSDSSPASWDGRQAASTGHQRTRSLNFDSFSVKVLQVYRLTVLPKANAHFLRLVFHFFLLDASRIKLYSIMCRLKPLSLMFSADLRRSPCKRGLFIMSAGRRWRQGCLCATLEKPVKSKLNKHKLCHCRAILTLTVQGFYRGLKSVFCPFNLWI